MDHSILWDHEVPVTELGVSVPPWIEQDIDPATIAAIIQGGCASGAYMAAMWTHQAIETMAEHGNAIIAYLQEHDYTLEAIAKLPDTKSLGFACQCVAKAVETWAAGVADEVVELLEEGS